MNEEATPLPVGSADAPDHLDRDHLRKEVWTMALYVTVCLLAALTALQNVGAVPGRVLGLIWGTTIGLALAHLSRFGSLADWSMRVDCPKLIKSSPASNWPQRQPSR
jgi:hypothetical protein